MTTKNIRIVSQEDSISPMCSLCGKNKANPFFRLPQIPTQSGVFSPSPKRASMVSRSDIILSYCDACGFICNEGHNLEKLKFDSNDFSLAESSSYQIYIDQLTDRLIKKYNLYGKKIIEVGCGEGYFLQEICRKGNNIGIGFDPGPKNKLIEKETQNRLKFIRAYYSSNYHYLQPDFLVCRLLLDLISEPITFLKMVRENLGSSENPIVYFEVPNTNNILDELSIYSFGYEHRSCFTKESLTYIFSLCGFEVLDIYSCWENNYLAIEARPTSSLLSIAEIRELQRNVNKNLKEKTIRLNQAFQKLKSETDKRLHQLQLEHKKVLAWGAGTRAVTFFNVFDANDLIPFIVDINARRHGKYLPGSGQKVVAPEFVLTYKPDLVLISNPTYADEIISQVRSLGQHPEFWIL
ncbi:MAG: methyltransferase domain-containing protein [Bacteroidia bacterium]|nr:methyltransferase domain-containing protein [Bacteroidia bacterium]